MQEIIKKHLQTNARYVTIDRDVYHHYRTIDKMVKELEDHRKQDLCDFFKFLSNNGRKAHRISNP